MRSPASVLLTAAALLLALAGCTLEPLPAPPTSEDAARHYEMMLDRTWQTTGLSGLMDRPTVEAADPVPQDEWITAVFSCMTEEGYAFPGFGSERGSGFLLSAEATETPSEVQLAFYLCLAANPPEMPVNGRLLSSAQLNYIYDYYVRWIVPCLVLNGYEVRTAVSREEFIALEGEWSPYEAIIPADVSDFETSVERCGPTRPPLE